MGSWGAGLYQDDVALDLKATIGVLADIPMSGEELLRVLIANHHEPVSLDADGGPTFWLVVADQCTKRGIDAPEATRQALTAIRSGADLNDLKARDADAKTLRQRAKVHEALLARLVSPRTPAKVPKTKRLPPFVLQPGQVWSFPTMQGQSINPYMGARWVADEFHQDGWGAMLVVAIGRAFDWIPWAAISALSVPPDREPTLHDAAIAKLYSNQGATYCVQRGAHLKTMQMRPLGSLRLDAERAATAITDEATPQRAAICGWTYTAQARAWRPEFPGGIAVAELLASAS